MIFGVSFWNKKKTFEVFLKKDDRWQLHVLCDEEKEAINEAQLLLRLNKTTQVKVVRHRMLSNAATSEMVVYEATATPPKAKPIVVSTPVGDLAVCKVVDDLYTADARRTIGQVMRDYMQRSNICTTELLHSFSHIRKLQDAQGLVNAGMHRIGAAQAAALNVPVKERMTLLDGLLTQCQQKARTFAAERGNYPEFRGQNLGELSTLIQQKVGLGEHDYVLNSLISVWLFEFRSLLAKVDILARLAQENVESGLVRHVDAILADTMIFAEVVQELFAPQPNLGTALKVMGSVILCRKGVADKIVNPTMRIIATLIQQGHLPQTQAALADRLLREINTDRPLDQRAPEQDGALLDELVLSLTGEDGTILGGERTHQSVERRRLRQRQEMLRAQGLHSVADNLR
ncbi:hypothetical protein CHU95_19620 [Niveispirillum lacus]|uniref:Uncharacterized protein n=1 Tax=Niveispirillum lacus TaxID=1981099 RepID=A0A255YQ70_9PROT|nr:hypothetical protein [Niveispirillum lacus]OYQ31373.1 hypothetical protein CHU95_19620 [Niveispirillum lacus]